MYDRLVRFLPPTAAMAATALAYAALLVLLFLIWEHGGAEFRYLQL